MKTRILFGSIMIVVLTALLWWDHSLQAAGVTPVGAPLAGLTAILLTVGYLEYARLARSAKLSTLNGVGIVGSLAIGLSPLWTQWTGNWPVTGTDLALVTIGVVFALVLLAQMVRYRTDKAMRRTAGTMGGVIYLGVLAAAMLAMRVQFGMNSLVLFLAAVKCTDIGAYFTGSFIGKHKMIPWLSPGKTWEGLAGGIIAAAGVSMALNAALGVGLQLHQAAILGAILGPVGQFGDLCESLFKRDAGLKDSGALIPQFGGVLDLVDSPLVAAPVGYVLLAVYLTIG